MIPFLGKIFYFFIFFGWLWWQKIPKHIQRFAPPFFGGHICIQEIVISHLRVQATSRCKKKPAKNPRTQVIIRRACVHAFSNRSKLPPCRRQKRTGGSPRDQKFLHFFGVGCFMAVLSRWRIPNFPSRWDFIVTNRWHHGFQAISKKKASSHPCFRVSPAIFLIRKSLLSIDGSEIRRAPVEVGKTIPLFPGL